jgi:hypothetical protein
MLKYWHRILEKLIVIQLANKLPIFYGTQSFIIVFTRAPPIGFCPEGHEFSRNRDIPFPKDLSY